MNVGSSRGRDVEIVDIAIGLLVADRWIEKVLEVKSASDRLLVGKVIVG